MSFEHKEFELYSTKQPEIEFLHLNSYYDDCFINLFNRREISNNKRK